MAVESLPVAAALWPTAVVEGRVAVARLPMAVEWVWLASEPEPTAVALSAVASALLPTALEPWPVALAPSPQAKEFGWVAVPSGVSVASAHTVPWAFAMLAAVSNKLPTRTVRG